MAGLHQTPGSAFSRLLTSFGKSAIRKVPPKAKGFPAAEMAERLIKESNPLSEKAIFNRLSEFRKIPAEKRLPRYFVEMTKIHNSEMELRNEVVRLQMLVRGKGQNRGITKTINVLRTIKMHFDRLSGYYRLALRMSNIVLAEPTEMLTQKQRQHIKDFINFYTNESINIGRYSKKIIDLISKTDTIAPSLSQDKLRAMIDELEKTESYGGWQRRANDFASRN